MTVQFHLQNCSNAYRKYRNLQGGGVMLLIHKEILHMPLIELDNDSESVWAKVFANKTSHYIASWYQEPSGSCEDFQLLRNQPEHIKTQHKKLPSVHILGDFNFRDIVWPERLSKKWDHAKSVRGASTCGHYERPWIGTAGEFPDSGRKYTRFDFNFITGAVSRGTLS